MFVLRIGTINSFLPLFSLCLLQGDPWPVPLLGKDQLKGVCNDIYIPNLRSFKSLIVPSSYLEGTLLSGRTSFLSITGIWSGKRGRQTRRPTVTYALRMELLSGRRGHPVF